MRDDYYPRELEDRRRRASSREANTITKHIVQNGWTSDWSSITLFHHPFEPIIYPNGWSLEKLEPYRKSQTLRRERRDAKDFSPMNSRFLDLPAEIRNKIYAELFHFDYTELAPLAPTVFTNGTAQTNLARRHHMHKYKHEIVPNLRFLRMNKQVHREATPIFYGENEFRFSNEYSFDLLSHLCFTIGKTNTALLRKITEALPRSLSRSRGNGESLVRRSGDAWSNFQILVREKMGMRKTERRTRKLNAARPIARDGGGLEEYKLIIYEHTTIDDNFDIFSAGGLLRWMSRAKLQNIKAQLVLLEEVEKPRFTGREGQTRQVVKHAEHQGWQVVLDTYDWLGCYEGHEIRQESESGAVTSQS